MQCRRHVVWAATVARDPHGTEAEAHNSDACSCCCAATARPVAEPAMSVGACLCNPAGLVRASWGGLPLEADRLRGHRHCHKGERGACAASQSQGPFVVVAQSGTGFSPLAPKRLQQLYHGPCNSSITVPATALSQSLQQLYHSPCNSSITVPATVSTALSQSLQPYQQLYHGPCNCINSSITVPATGGSRVPDIHAAGPAFTMCRDKHIHEHTYEVRVTNTQTYT